jgi:hypothetical protein
LDIKEEEAICQAHSRNSTMAQYNNPYYLATGDGGVSEATVVPDFTSIPNSENFLINSNLGDKLNFRQTLVLKDNFLETLQREEYPRASTQTETNSSVEFEFSLPGYVHCKDLIMNWRFLLSNPTAIAALPDTSYQTPYAMLNLLDYYEIKIGNNSFILGRPEFTNDLMAIKTYLSTKWSSEEELISRGVLGSPTSKFYNTNQATFDPDWNFYAKAEWCNMWFFTQSRVDEPFFIDIPIALSSLAPFFDQDAYLPPLLKLNFKFFFKYNNTSTSADILQNCTVFGADTTPTFSTILNFTAPPQTSNFFFVYNYKLIKEEYNKVFNAMMMEKDLLYNFFNMRTFRRQCEANNFSYDIPITWSKQRPQELFFTLEYGDQSEPDECVFGTSPQMVNSALGYCGGFYIQLLEVYANGQIISRFRNRGIDQMVTNYNTELLTQAAPPFSAYDMLQNLNISRMTKLNTDDYNALTSDTILINNVMPVRILLDPAQDYNNNQRSLDKGTTNLRVRITLVPFRHLVAYPDNWLVNWPKYSMVFRFKEAAQLAIDAQQNVQEIDWPCVRANSKKYLNFTNSSINAN